MLDYLRRERCIFKFWGFRVSRVYFWAAQGKGVPCTHGSNFGRGKGFETTFF